MFAPKIGQPHAQPQTRATEAATSRLGAQRSTIAGHGRSRNPVAQGHFVQGTIGNQAALRRSTKQAWNSDQEMSAGNLALSGKRDGFSRDFSKTSVFSPERVDGSRPPFSPPPERFPNILQAKLKVGAVDDPLEREADRVAEQVMRTPDATAAGSPAPMGCSCASGMQRKPAGPQVSSSGTSTTKSAMHVPPTVHGVLRSAGQPLDSATRAFMEPRFGRDFRHVKVHAGAEAAEAAHDVQARAFAVGHHIVFGAGESSFPAQGGSHLLAHELAHVVQQCGHLPPRGATDDSTSALLQREPKAGPAIVRSTHAQLEARSIEIYRDAATAYLNAKRTEVTEGALGSLKRELTVAALEGNKGGAIAKRVAINNPKYEPYVKSVLRPDEVYVDKGVSRKSHAERTGAKGAALEGIEDALVATSNKGCPHCIRAIDEDFPELAHVNPKIASRGSVQPSGRVARPVTTNQIHLDPTDKYRGGRTPPRDASHSVTVSGEINTADLPEPKGSSSTTDPSVIVDEAQLHSAAPTPNTEVNLSHGNPTSGVAAHTPPAVRPPAGGVRKALVRAGKQAYGAGGKTMYVAGVVGAGGHALKQLYERDYVGAAKTAGVTTAGLAAGRWLGEAAGPLFLAYSTIEAYDDETKRDADRAGSRVEQFIGEGSKFGRFAGAVEAANVAVAESAYKGIKAPWESQYTDSVKKTSTGAGEKVENFIGRGSTPGRVAGAIASSAVATGEVAFKGTFGAVGEGIGEGVAAGYLWATGQRPADFESPAYYQEFVSNLGKLGRAKAHLTQVIASQPGSPAAAAAGQMLKQVAELDAINWDYKQRKISTFWLGPKAGVLEAQAALLH